MSSKFIPEKPAKKPAATDAAKPTARVAPDLAYFDAQTVALEKQVTDATAGVAQANALLAQYQGALNLVRAQRAMFFPAPPADAKAAAAKPAATPAAPAA